MSNSMYTSFLGNRSSGLGSRSGKRNRQNGGVRSQAIPTREQLTSELQNPGTLKLNQKLLNGKAIVSKSFLNWLRIFFICQVKRINRDFEYINGEIEYVIYHEDFRQEFILRKINKDEDITKWIDLQVHSNIATAFDSFTDEISECKFAMIEANNGGNIY